MSSITLITGSIDEIIDPNQKLNYNELYYEFWRDNQDDEEYYSVFRDDFPITRYGNNKARIVQYLGSGKTLMGVQLLAERAFQNQDIAANLALVWHNFGTDRDNWTAKINTIDDFMNLENCTILLDDIRSTISHFACPEASLISEIANAGRKLNLDFISTAQREIMFPKDLRDMATEWIVPVIRVRDMTKWTPDNTGQPIEMISLHFDGAKNFLFMSEPYRDLNRLFKAYETLQRAIGLRLDTNSEKRNHKKIPQKNIFVKE